MPSDDPRRALIERYVTAYNAFDVPGMLATLHADVAFENIAGGELTAQANGIDAFCELAERGVTLFTTRRQTITDYAAEGDAGATIHVDYEGVLAADVGPTMRAGDTLRVAGRSTFQFRDGLIARIVDES
jgi:ketosteroid isomerase-like protein